MHEMTEDARISYGRVAVWGMAASAVLTVAFLALSPVSPVKVAARVLEGGPAALVVGGDTGRTSVDAVDVGVAEAVRSALGGYGLGGQGGALGEELRVELRRELIRGLRGGSGAGLRRELVRGLSAELPALTREISRQMADDVTVEIRAGLSPG